jgi:chorismate synthase
MNTFGVLYRVSIFGESHGPMVGAVVHGIPAGTPLDIADVQRELDRRRGGQSRFTTQRSETDTIHIHSGILDDVATGAPIAYTFQNQDTESDKYVGFRDRPRPGHSDYPAHVKYHGHNDIRGAGHFSGRLTAPLLAAGALARQTLAHHAGVGFRLAAYASNIAGIAADIDPDHVDLDALRERTEAQDTRCPDPTAAERMEEAIEAARRDQDSVGGIVTAVASGLGVGLGEPFFDSVESVLAHLLYAVPAVKGVSFGSGFGLSAMRGSMSNDPYTFQEGRVVKGSNHAGGVLGGLTDGGRVVVHACVKPASSIAQEQHTIDLKKGEEATLRVTGRHDPCIVIRAVPVIENVVAIGMLDLYLRSRAGAPP